MGSTCGDCRRSGLDSEELANDEEVWSGATSKLNVQAQAAPTGANLLAQLLDLRAANPGHNRALVCVAGDIVVKEIPRGSRLGQLLPTWKASLVSGLLKPRADGDFSYFDSVELLKAVAGEKLDPNQLDGSVGCRSPAPAAAGRFQKLQKLGDSQVIVWNINSRNPCAEQKLLQYALDLVVFNADSTFQDLQATMETILQDTWKSLQDRPDKFITDLWAQSSGSTEVSFSSMPELDGTLTKLKGEEQNYVQISIECMPICSDIFLKLLQEPEVTSEVGFQMRCVFAGHPEIATFEFTHILGLMSEKKIAVAQSGKIGARQRVVLSDIDDTVHPAHDAGSIAIAGMDITNVAHGEVYPNIEAVHRALRPEFANNQCCYPVFLSARPPALAKKCKPELQLLARKMVGSDSTIIPSKELYCSILPGADDINGLVEAALCILHQNIPTMQKGMIVPLGRKKIERVYDYARLFPEMQYVFIGDDGQGDFEAARGLLELRRLAANRDGLPIGPPMTDLFEELDQSQEEVMGAKEIMGAHDSVGHRVSESAAKVAGWAARLITGDDGYIAMLYKDVARRGVVKFSDSEPALFDFVAIRAVNVKGGSLFQADVRKQRTKLMRQLYGEKRFFYFEDYADLLRQLQEAGWAKLE